MKNILHPKDCEKLIARIQQLHPANSRRWGVLTIEQMLAHLADPLRADLNEIDRAS